MKGVGKMADNVNDSEDLSERSPWQYITRGMWRTPLGLFGLVLTMVSITLMVVGVAFDLLGFIKNPYANLFTYLVLPGGMVTGLVIIPIAAFLRRRQWHKFGITREHLRIDLSNKKHRKALVIFVVLSVVNISILGLIGYEGYNFTESPTFCGKLCHQVMAPEYTVYKRSPHANVEFVECHIGPGAAWFIRAKISGLRQVVGVMTDSYSRPVPAPIEHLRSARDTCENCHWPDKFYGKKVKTIKHFSNDDQKSPEVTNIVLHIGGRNPATGAFEGIHWHVSNGVEIKYLAADDKRTQVARVKVKRPDNTRDEFVKADIKVPGEKTDDWRTMDCTDCHNRPGHKYDMPEDVVDFGLSSKKINPNIPGIREDAFTVLTTKYADRAEAEKKIASDLLVLQSKRDPKNVKKYKEDIKAAGSYLVKGYLGNVWPKMNIFWGTYQNRLGHKSEDYGNYKYASSDYGCFRCHDDEHETNSGKTISQNCDFCHDDPE